MIISIRGCEYENKQEQKGQLFHFLKRSSFLLE